MASRRDQLQSYQFLVHRTISAFVMRQTDPATSPLRRGVGAVFAISLKAWSVAAQEGGPTATRTQATQGNHNIASIFLFIANYNFYHTLARKVESFR